MSGRAVLVTGGAAGIGWATARRFAAGGDRVLIADIDGDRAAARAEELGSGHRHFRADLSDAVQVRATISACAAAFGRLDVLVNNAGRIDTSGTGIVDQPTDVFRRLLALNLEGTVVAAEEAARLMARQGGGAIVNVASGAALRAIPLRNAYSASKAAVVAATRNLACRLVRDGIQVNAIAPGYTRTELVDELIRNGRVDPSKAVQRIPLGRMGWPEEMAEAIFHLASPAARPFVGGLLLVDGGGQAYGGSEDAGIARGAEPAAAPSGMPVIVLAGGEGTLASALEQQVASRGARVVRLGSAITPYQGAGAPAIDIDVTDRADVERTFQQIVERFGRIDGLVIVADDLSNGGSAADLGAVLDRDFTGLFHLAQGAGRQMLRQGYGSVVAVTSVRGQIGLAGDDATAATSAAIAMFTRSMACEWGGSGVRANTLAVGPMNDRDPLLRRMPLRRAVSARELAANIDFLVSPAASYITGAVVPLDGGLSIYAGPDFDAIR